MKSSGEVWLGSIDSDKKTSQALKSCCHCGRIFEVLKGSGKLRGFCTLCMGDTCGPLCPAGPGCVPQIQFVTNKEQGRANNHRDLIVPFNDF